MKRIITAIIVMAILTLTITGCVKTEELKPTESPETKATETEAPKVTEKPKETVKPKATVAPKQTAESAPSEAPTEEAKETAKATKAPKATEKVKKTSEPKETGHVHNWVPITETQRVCMQEAYDEPIYEEIAYVHCSCGADMAPEEKTAHMKEHALALEVQYSWGIAYKTIQTGTKHHDAVYENREVTVGYRCECGATK